MLRAYVHRVRCGSWACPKCALILGRVLCERLSRGERNIATLGLRFVLLTLTFDPKRFESPAAAMRLAKGGRWVAECLRKWQRSRGVRVEYLAKWELCKSGWPHVMILLVVPMDFRFKNPRVEGGEFDDFWLHGISDVDWRDLGGLSAYTSKLAAYTTKGAGNGCAALEASGLPASGFHWVQPSHGFWKRLGVPAVDPRYIGRWGDESMRDDEGRAARVVVSPRGPRWASHAERVAGCGSSSALVVEGGMRDERARVEGGHGSTFTVELPCTRRHLGEQVEEFFGPGGAVEYIGELQGLGGIVAGVRLLRPSALLRFLVYLGDFGGVDMSGVDLGQVRRRIGWLYRSEGLLPFAVRPVVPDEAGIKVG